MIALPRIKSCCVGKLEGPFFESLDRARKELSRIILRSFGEQNILAMKCLPVQYVGTLWRRPSTSLDSASTQSSITKINFILCT